MEESSPAFINLNVPLWRKLLLFLAPILAFYLIFFVELDANNSAITNTLAVALWMALWWVAEIVPLAITSLLPIVLFPLLGIMNGKMVSSTYFNHVIFLFIGGFLVALAIQKWNLHQRIALTILKVVGLSPAKILFGFMFATAFLSMWISNTATTMMMVPILLSITVKLEEINGKQKTSKFAVGLLLATAYSASVGGLATLIGTPPNLSFSRIFDIYFPNAPEISFVDWFSFAFPISVMMFLILFIYLKIRYIKKSDKWKSLSKEVLSNDLKKMGKMTFEEKIIGALFILMALLWFFRSDINLGFIHIVGWSSLFSHPEYINDGTVAIFISVILFIIPSKTNHKEYLMTWKDAEDIPWEIILLFGGGFALASGFKESGLSMWFGEQLIWLKDVHPLLIIFCIGIVVTFLTELTSNTATVETFLPILAGLAVTIESNPLLFMLPATLAGSMAFMLPVATPPNAIIFGTKKVRITEMIKAGLFLNIVGAIIITIAVYYLGTSIFNIDINTFPDWANGK